jgi:hypothetical protein
MKDFNEHKGNPVSYRMFPGMPDTIRYVIFAVLLVVGFSIQTQIGLLVPGIICLTCASLFLMFKGIDKRIFQYKVSETNEWVKTERGNIQEMLRIVKALKSWDQNIFEISNLSGCLVFLAVCAVLFAMIVAQVSDVVILDVLALFLPFFLSGMLRTDSKPGILIKTENLIIAATFLREKFSGYEYTYYTLLTPVKNKTKPAPSDIKIKINPPAPSEKFLGIYGQCSLNNVSGVFYPYLYYVIVFKKGFNLKDKIESILGSNKNITCEFTTTADAEVLIIRQTTSKTSGYQTKPKDIAILLNYTISVYEKYLQ